MREQQFLRRLGANIRAARWRAGRTQRELAERINSKPRYLLEVEQGERNPSAVFLWRLARELDVTIGALVEIPGATGLKSLAGIEVQPPRRGRKPKVRRRLARSRL